MFTDLYGSETPVLSKAAEPIRRLEKQAPIILKDGELLSPVDRLAYQREILRILGAGIDVPEELGAGFVEYDV